MSFLSRIRSTVRNLLRKEEAEQQLDDEVRAYVDMVAEERIAAGIPAAEARRTALAEFGGLEQVKQAVREQRSGVGFELIWQDVRYGLRQLRRNRAFTFAAVLTLGLGIGATTAIFSAVYSLLLRPLPYPNAGRLISLSSQSPSHHTPFPEMILSPDYVAARVDAKAFRNLAAYQYRLSNLTRAGEAARVTLIGATADFLPMLGAKPEVGRLFTDADDQPGAASVTVLSDRLWRSQFHTDPGVIGRTVEVGGVATTIIGVTPEGFSFPSLDIEPDIYQPLHLDHDTAISVEKPVFGLQVVGRLAAGVSAQQAQAEMQSFFDARALHDYPPTLTTASKGRRMVVETLQRHIAGDNRKSLYILLACVGAVLLIACANVANLQLARAVSRQHETALRGALGASRVRLARQFLVESLILSALAAGVGLATAWMVTTAVRYAGAPDAASHGHLLTMLRLPFGKLSASITIDGWVLTFVAGLSVITTLLFGLAPAVRGSRVDLRSGLQSAALRMSAGREQQRLRHALLLVEVALAVTLLASASLLVRSFVNVLRYDAGFNSANTLTGTTLLNDSTTPQQVRTFLAGLLPRLQALPGVESAAVTSSLPMQGGDGIPYLIGDGPVPPVGTWPQVMKMSVTPDYFRAIGTALVRGRAFTDADNENAPHVAIVNRAFEKAYFAGDALGKRFRTDVWGKTPYEFSPVTVVGIADDVRYGGMEQEIQPAVFLPESQSADGEINIVLRTSATSGFEPDSLANAMRRAVLAVDAKQPVFAIETMDQRLSGMVAERRMIMLLIACFALLAVVLSAVGVYGVFAYSVSQRSHEMGIRLALGATRRGLLRLVMMQAARLIAVGGVLGMMTALMLSRLLASLLVGVTAHDTLSFALAWGLMTTVALLASALPAVDAARTDLLATLHTE